MANSVGPDQTAPIGAVCSWSTPFASILNLSVMLDNSLQQTTSTDDNFRSFFLGALRVNQATTQLCKIELFLPSIFFCCKAKMDTYATCLQRCFYKIQNILVIQNFYTKQRPFSDQFMAHVIHFRCHNF